VQQRGIERGLVRNPLRESARIAEKWIADIAGEIWYRRLHQREGLVGDLLQVRLTGDALVEDAIATAQDHALGAGNAPGKPDARIQSVLAVAFDGQVIAGFDDSIGQR